jgi:hypothetical protein
MVCNPSAEEVGGLGIFLYEAAQNFDQNLKFRNLAVDETLFEAYPMLPSWTDQIRPDVTFKGEII